MDQKSPFYGAVNSCGIPQQSNIRPQNIIDAILNKNSDERETETEEMSADSGGARASDDPSGSAGAGEADEEGEAAKAKVARTPEGPSKIERDDHDATHMPYRSWCVACVAGRGVASPHVQSEQERNKDEIGMDYCFPRGMKEDAPKVLALRSRRDGTTIALVVPKKGLPEEWVAARIAKTIDDIGLNDVTMIVKSDGEPAMKALRGAVSRIRRAENKTGVIEEEAQRADSAGNGMIEKAVQEVEGMIRTLRKKVEMSTGATMKKGSAAMVWLIEHSASLITRYKVGADGLVAYKRVKGKNPSNLVIPWGERVMYMPPKATRIDDGDGKSHSKTKDDFRYNTGIYLGIKGDSNESWIGTESGKVISARSIRRMSDDEKWRIDEIESIVGLPWDLKGEKRGEATADLEVPERAGKIPEVAPEWAQKESANDVRRMMIPRSAIIKYGPTPRCQQCVAIVHGKDRGPGHNETCRKRIEDLMKETPEGLSKVNKGAERMTNAFLRKIEKEEAEADSRKKRRTEESTSRDDDPSARVEKERVTEPIDEQPNRETTAQPVPDEEDLNSQEAKRRRIDEMSREEKAVRYLTPMVGPTCNAEVLDLTRGGKYSFDARSSRASAMRKVLDMQPSMIITGELRGAQSTEKADRHAKFNIDLMRQQAYEGKYFAFEADADSAIWKWHKLDKIKHMPGVRKCYADAHQHGIDKKIAIITNCKEVRENISLGNKSDPAGEQGKTHSRKLCEAVRAGVTRRLKKDAEDIRSIEEKIVKNREISKTDEARWSRYRELQIKEDGECDREMIAAIDEEWKESWYPDHVNGGYLDPVKLKAARREEMEYVYKFQVYDKVSRAECVEKTGKNPIKVRWVDTNKGLGQEEDNYRSRLVAMEFKRGNTAEYFSATPPLEMMRTILSSAASSKTGSESDKVVLYLDVRRAYFHAPSKRPTFVEIPKEDDRGSNVGMCGRLRASLYGTRDAADNWAQAYGDLLIGLGLRKGKSSPCLFLHKEWGIKVLVHGDDFLCAGPRANVEWLRAKIKEKYETKDELMGPGANDVKKLTVLNREIRWTSEGIEIEGDHRHVTAIVRGLGIEDSRSLTIPIEKDEAEAEVDEELEGPAATMYRSIAARCNYLASDRPDIQFAVKRCCKAMCRPCRGDLARLKRLGRYLKGRPRLVQVFQWQGEIDTLDIYVDSDWAGDRRTRKSTSAGAIFWGSHLIRSWSKDQDIIALSSAEAELHAASYGAMQLKGLKSLSRDVGLEFKLNVHIDASAAIGIIRRQGLGKLRHIEVRDLWLQQEVKDKMISLHKVESWCNPADLGTKALGQREIERHVKCMGLRWGPADQK